MKRYFKFGCFIVILGTSCFALWLLREVWLWLTGVDADVLATWALLATLALPFVALGGLLLGRRDAGIRVDGLDMGIEKVMGMAEKVSDIRDRSAAKIKQPPVQVAVLPQLQQGGVIHRELTSGEDQKVIDL